jgi:hypothetical protein
LVSSRLALGALAVIVHQIGVDVHAARKHWMKHSASSNPLYLTSVVRGNYIPIGSACQPRPEGSEGHFSCDAELRERLPRLTERYPTGVW